MKNETYVFSLYKYPFILDTPLTVIEEVDVSPNIKSFGYVVNFADYSLEDDIEVIDIESETSGIVLEVTILTVYYPVDVNL